MKRNAVAIACVVLVSVVALVAQTADAISGRWGSDGRPLLELKADAGGAVTGTVFFYGGGKQQASAPIKTGTFDARTGALRLAGEVTAGDRGPTAYLIEGTLAQGTLRVYLTTGDYKGSEALTRLAAQQATAAGGSSRPGTVLITGANRGLGLEFVRQYAANGWTVIATARTPETAKELRDLAAGQNRITIEKLDVLDTAAIKALAAKYTARPIDVIVNNAGVLGDMKAQTLGALDYAEFEEVMAVNVYAPLAIAEAFRDHVAASDQKKIVSITSRSGIISLPGSRGPYFYRASKIGLNMVMRVLADDLRGRGVIVGIVSPPPTETDMLRALIGPENAARQAKPADVIAGVIKVIDGLTLADTDTVKYFDGTALPW